MNIKILLESFLFIFNLGLATALIALACNGNNIVIWFYIFLNLLLKIDFVKLYKTRKERKINKTKHI